MSRQFEWERDKTLSPLPWQVVSEVIRVADPPRYRVAIRASNGYRVVVENEPLRWEQAQKDFEMICMMMNDPRYRVDSLGILKSDDLANTQPSEKVGQ